MKNWIKILKLTESNWLTNLAIWLILIVPLVFSTAMYSPFGFGRYVWIMFVLAFLSLSLLVSKKWEINYFWWRHPIVWLTSIWLLITVISSLVGVNTFRSLWGTVSRGGTGVFFFLALWIMGWLLLLAINNREHWLKFFSVMSWVGGFSALYAVFQTLRISWLPIIDSGSRASGLMGNPIFFGQLLLLTVFITLYFAVVSRGRLRWWYIASFILQFIAIFLTASRGPILGLIIGIIIWLIVFQLFYRKTWKANWRWVTGISFAVVGAITTIVLLAPRLEFTRIFNFSSDSVITRLVTWQTAWDAIQAKPFLGYGLENAWYAFAHFYKPGLAGINFSETVIDRAHNFILDQLLVNGWLGLLVMLVILIYLILALWRYTKNESQRDNLPKVILGWSLIVTLVAYYVANLTAFDTIVTNIYGAAILAGVVALLSEDSPKQILLKPVLLWRFVLILIFCCFVFFDIKYLVPAVRIGRNVELALSTQRRGDYQGAAKAYADAQGPLNPYRWSFMTNYPIFVQQYNSLLLREEKYDWVSSITVDGLRVISNIKQHEPDRVAILMQEQILLAVLSNFEKTYEEKAEKSFNKLVEEFPNHEYIYINWARTLMGMGNYTKALDVLNDIPQRFEVLPKEYEFWRALANIQLKSNDRNQIVEDLRVNITRNMNYSDGDQNVLRFMTAYLINRNEWKIAGWYQEKIVILSPEDVDERINLSAIYKELGEYDKAAEQARIVVQLDPSKTELTKQFLQSIGRSL
ncbi:O-antigen ligase family protein [Patescibacteria group bacterium]|nr:O-antigen ligase family protein [Patescibacteria group bacterium]